MRTTPQRGFTLLEMMTTLAVAGVLLAIAVPNMRTFIQNSRLTSAANDLLRSFQIARTEAIKRQQNVVVCASANPSDPAATCSYGAFSGWIVFQDGDITAGVAPDWQRDGADPIIERHELLDASVQVRNDNNGIESYGQTGFANPAGAEVPTRNIVLCDTRGIQPQAGTLSTARAFRIDQLGGSRVINVNTDVAATMVLIGGSCP